MSSNLAVELAYDLTEIAASWICRLQEMNDRALPANQLKQMLQARCGSERLAETPYTEAKQVYAALKFLVDNKPNDTIPELQFEKILHLIRHLPAKTRDCLEELYQQSKQEHQSQLRQLNLYRLAISYVSVKEVDENLSALLKQHFFLFLNNTQQATTNIVDQDTLQFIFALIIDLSGIFNRALLLFLGSHADEHATNPQQYGHFDRSRIRDYLAAEDKTHLLYSYQADLNQLLNSFNRKTIPYKIQIQTLLNFSYRWFHETLKLRIKEFIVSDKNTAKFTANELEITFLSMLKYQQTPSTLLFHGIHLTYGHYLQQQTLGTTDNPLPNLAKIFYQLLLNPLEDKTIIAIQNHFNDYLESIVTGAKLDTDTEAFLAPHNLLLFEISQGLSIRSLPQQLSGILSEINHFILVFIRHQLEQWQTYISSKITNMDQITDQTRQLLTNLMLQYIWFSHLKAQAALAIIYQEIDKESHKIYNTHNFSEPYSTASLNVLLMASELHLKLEQEFKNMPFLSIIHNLAHHYLIYHAENKYPKIKATLTFAKKHSLLSRSQLKLYDYQQTLWSAHIKPKLPAIVNTASIKANRMQYLAINFYLAYATLELTKSISLTSIFSDWIFFSVTIQNTYRLLKKSQKARLKYFKTSHAIHPTDIQQSYIIIEELTNQLKRHALHYCDYLHANQVEYFKQRGNPEDLPKAIKWFASAPNESPLNKIIRLKNELNNDFSSLTLDKIKTETQDEQGLKANMFILGLFSKSMNIIARHQHRLRKIQATKALIQIQQQTATHPRLATIHHQTSHIDVELSDSIPVPSLKNK